MKSFTSIQVGDEKVKVPHVISQMLSEIAQKWQCSKATAVEIIVAQMHGQEFPMGKKKIKLPPPRMIEISHKQPKQLPRVGCYLGWEGCTNTADVSVGNGWVCHNCNRHVG